GLAGRLARVLDRRLVRLRAGVAEEGRRAAEALGKQRGELGHRLAPEEVGDVPEPVELPVRGRERSRVPVAEADDGDPAGEVEVAAAIAGEEPATFAVDEGDVGARVGRHHGAVDDRSHPTTTVCPISARTPTRAALTAACSFGTMPPSSSGSRRSASSAAIRGRITPGTSVWKTIRSAPRPIASAAAASSAFTFSGPTASGATTGIRPAASASRIACGRLGDGTPT